jgi:hypothetical protein
VWHLACLNNFLDNYFWKVNNSLLSGMFASYWAMYWTILRTTCFCLIIGKDFSHYKKHHTKNHDPHPSNWIQKNVDDFSYFNIWGYSQLTRPDAYYLLRPWYNWNFKKGHNLYNIIYNICEIRVMWRTVELSM